MSPKQWTLWASRRVTARSWRGARDPWTWRPWSLACRLAARAPFFPLEAPCSGFALHAMASGSHEGPCARPPFEVNAAGTHWIARWCAPHASVGYTSAASVAASFMQPTTGFAQGLGKVGMSFLLAMCSTGAAQWLVTSARLTCPSCRGVQHAGTSCTGAARRRITGGPACHVNRPPARRQGSGPSCYLRRTLDINRTGSDAR